MSVSGTCVTIVKCEYFEIAAIRSSKARYVNQQGGLSILTSSYSSELLAIY